GLSWYSSNAAALKYFRYSVAAFSNDAIASSNTRVSTAPSERSFAGVLRFFASVAAFVSLATNLSQYVGRADSISFHTPAIWSGSRMRSYSPISWFVERIIVGSPDACTELTRKGTVARPHLLGARESADRVTESGFLRGCDEVDCVPRPGARNVQKPPPLV